MRFSSLIAVGDNYQLNPGVTFALSKLVDMSQISSSAAALPHREVDGGRFGHLRISDELLVSGDALVRQYRERSSNGYCDASTHEVTVVRGAIRKIGDFHCLLSEAEVASCEKIHKAHALYIAPSAGEIAKREAGKLIDQLLLPRLAVLTEGDELEMHVFKDETIPGTMLRNSERVKKIAKTCTVSFDGTALKVDGINLAAKSPECFG